jgi:uncharacterized DUF497 family protein
MELEWDEGKRQWALDNRMLDFADVDRFDAQGLRTFSDLRRDYGEVRFNTYGYLDGVLCTFCWTPRNGRIRVISMRKANDREKERYLAGKDPRHA